MVCYHPLEGYRALHANSNGKRPIVFSRRAGYEDRPVSIACGQCVGCRLERSRVWATRCVHEAMLFDSNCFVTLTYADEYVPQGGTLVKAHFQNFMKRLRDRENYIGADGQRGIRFYMCGEYGENFGRPHYHVCLFNFDFVDKVPWRKTKHGDVIYRSAYLEELWPWGYSSIGQLTFESAAYVARYVMKKQTGKAAVWHYNDIDAETGEILNERLPEYNDMSRRPGIGSDWFKAYYNDLYPGDFVVHDNRKFRVPRFYDNRFEIVDAASFRDLKRSRVCRAKLHAENNTRDRLRVREVVAKARLGELKRELK